MNPVVRKKTGLPDEAATTDPLHLQCFTPLCKYLNEMKKLAVTELMLSQLTFNLLQFMETKFGKFRSSERGENSSMVKLPYSIFRDFRTSGGLCTVFEVCSKHASISRWTSTNLMEDSNEELGIRLLLDIEQALLQSGLIRRPVFFFGPSVHEQPNSAQLVHELTEIALSHGGSVTEEELKASYLVVWDDEVDGSLDRELQEEYIRPLEIRPNQDSGTSLVHWWYHPDSYDEWIPSQDVQCTDTPDADKYMQLYQKNGYYQSPVQSDSAVYVSCRYLRDVQDFNEWGNLLDYELDKPENGVSAEVDVSSSTRKGRGKKRGVDRRQHNLQRQQNGLQSNRVVEQAVPVTERMLQDLPPPTLFDSGSLYNSGSHPSATNQPKVNIVDVAANQPCVMKSEAPCDVSRGTVEVKEEEGSDSSGGLNTKRKRAGDPEDGNFKRSVLSVPVPSGPDSGLEGRAVLNDPPSAVTAADPSRLLPGSQLPSWFSVDGISTVEMKYMSNIILSNSCDSVLKLKESNTLQQAHDAQFALTQMTGQKYQAMRNSIVYLYHQNVSTFLTATECRRKIAGDVAYIIRIHEFLDAFGIINYSPEIKTVFRNPKSAIYFASRCPKTELIRPTKAEKATSGFSFPSKQSIWTETLDQLLMQVVAAELELPPSPAANGRAHEVGGINWTQVADKVSSQVDVQKRLQFTSVACLVRFTEMNLTNVSSNEAAESLVPGISSLSSRAQAYVASGSAVSKNVRALASVVTAAASELVGIPRVQEVSQAVEATLKGTPVSSSAVASLSTGAALVSSAAQTAAQKTVAQAGTLLDDYIALRLSVLEKKAKLVGDIEDALLLEKERLQADRHDLQVERAQHASHVQSDAQKGLF